MRRQSRKSLYSGSCSRMKPIIGFAHVQIRDVRVNLCRRNIAMAQERWTERESAPCCIRCVPKLCRSVCGEMSGTPAVAAWVLIIRQALCRVMVRPRSQKQLGLTFVAELFSNRQVSLQPVNRALAQRDAPLFVALPWQVTRAASKSMSLTFNPHASETLRPAAYINSNRARSRTPRSVSISGANSSVPSLLHSGISADASFVAACECLLPDGA